MRRKNFYIGIFSLLIFVSAAIACGDPVTRASGIVRDENGNPLPGVRVVMESIKNNRAEYSRETEQLTQAGGGFDFMEITAPAEKVRLVFSKEGFNQTIRDITPSGENKLDIKLEKTTN